MQDEWGYNMLLNVLVVTDYGDVCTSAPGI